MSDTKKNGKDNTNTDWLDETGTLPAETDWLDETGTMPPLSGWLDETEPLPEVPDWLDETEPVSSTDDWDYDENGKPLHASGEEAAAAGTAEEKKKDVNADQRRRHAALLIGGLTAAAAAVIVWAGVSYWNGLREIEAKRLEIREVGGNLSDLNLDVSGTVQELADSRIQQEKEEKARQEAEERRARKEQAERDELDQEEGTVPIELSLSTIQSDLKVKIRNADTKSLIGSVPFRIKVTTPSGKTREYEDDDEDGIIYRTGLSSGKYQVVLEPLINLDQIRKDSEKDGSDYHDNKDYILYSKFKISEKPQSIEVTDRIAYEVVDVKDEIKSASEVNTAQEDTAHNDTAVEGTLQNTVAFVDSSKTEITDPSAAAASSAQAGVTVPAADPNGSAAGVSGTAGAAASDNTAATAGSAAEGNTAGQAAAAAAGTGTTPSAGSTENAAAGAADSTGTGETASAASSETAPAQPAAYKYTGWQTIDGKTYYFDANGVFVTGTQVIEGITYTFGDDGVLNTAASRTGIDVSQWNGTVDWPTVAASGMSFAIVRCGYRGSSQGMLVSDPMVGTNVMGAKNAGLKVGLYFFSQAVNEAEAVEEASMAVQMANTYGINMPIYLDVESSGGRGDAVSAAQRTANIAAFCQTVVNAGYSAGVYANTNWLTEKINAPALAGYNIWLAQYAAAPTYSATAFHMWQYTSTGRVNGISGNVDLNILY